MEVTLSLRELDSDLLTTTQIVGELLESHRCDFGVGALVAAFEVAVPGDIGLVVLRPNFVQVAMNVERLWVGDAQSFTPSCQRLTSAVGVVLVLF